MEFLFKCFRKSDIFFNFGAYLLIEIGMSVFAIKKNKDLRLSFRCGILLAVCMLSLSSGVAEAKTWYKKRVWYTRQDSVPIYERKDTSSNVVKYIVGKGMVINQRLSSDGGWLFPKEAIIPGALFRCLSWGPIWMVRVIMK